MRLHRRLPSAASVAFLAATPPLPPKRHPDPGDVCIGCVHEPNPKECHYFLIPGGMDFARPDDSTSTAEWILLCDRCFAFLPPEGIRSALERKLVLIGCDMLWPEGLTVKIQEKS